MDTQLMMPFIVIEGVDGVGKTTVSRELARRMKAVRLQTPPRTFGNTGTYIDRNPKSIAHFLFYLAAAHYVSERVRVLRQMRPVVCDRYVLSTSAYHVAYNGSVPLTITDLDIERPTLTFLLTVEESQRRKRMHKRRYRSQSERDLDDPVFLSKVIAGFRRYDLIEIDTTKLAISQVVDRMMGFIYDGTDHSKEIRKDVGQEYSGKPNIDRIVEFYIGLGFKGLKLRSALEEDSEYQELLRQRRRELTAQHLQDLSEADRRTYVLSVAEDFEILGRCKRLEKADLSKEDRALTRLIMGQLKDDWRSDIFLILNDLLEKYGLLEGFR